MAQQDTGLGWSAEDTYLIQSGPTHIGDMTVMGGDDFPRQPGATNCTTYADTIASGIQVVVGDNPSTYPSTYAASYTDSPLLFFYIESNGYLSVYAIATERRARIARAIQTIQTFSILPADDNYWAYDSTTNLYYYRISNSLTQHYDPGAILPGFSTVQDALNAVVLINTPIYKLYPGYAVAAIASWWTPAGVLITSPVLISSERNNATLSLNGTDVATQITDSVQYLGKIFYISYMTNLEGAPGGIVPIVDLTQFGAAYISKVFKIIATESYANILLTTAPPDPYEDEGGESGEEGGGGDETEDNPVEEETLPIPAVVGLGFSTIYVPTQTDLYNLAAYLWGGNLDLDNFLKLFANPMDSILGLSAVPLVLSGTYEPIYLGGQQLQGITMPRYTGRTAVKVDMGTATITERWGAYLDYDPYTELALYVPFVGIKNIKTDDVMGKTIRLMYDIDILSGACIAYIRPEGGSPLYEWSGQCAMQIPITGANWDNIFSTAINTVATLGGALFAPASAPVLGGAVASAASQAIAAKPRIERSGAVNGITGFLGQLRPYIIRTIPEAYIPNEQNKFIGYPSYVSVNLGSISGYNEIASIHLENIPATGDELAELESILKGGVIF